MTAAASTAPALELSVVVTVTSGGQHLLECLRRLAEQRDPPFFEVVVPVDASIGGVDGWRDAHREVRFVDLELPAAAVASDRFARTPGTDHLAYDRRRAAGLAAAQAPIVALTEDHARPDPDWCANVVAAHRRWPHAAIGGVIENACDRPLNWAAYFCDFGRYQGGLREGPARYVSDVNVSYKATALARVESSWTDSYHETAVHGALRAAGESLWLSPTLVVRQDRGPLRLGALLRERYAWGRLYAGKRVAEISRLRRGLLLVLAAGLPILLLARKAATVVARRRHRGAFVRVLPILVLLLAGELVGYATGRPTSRQ